MSKKTKTKTKRKQPNTDHLYKLKKHMVRKSLGT